MRVGELCTREVVVVEPETAVREVAALMREHHVGDVVVVEERAGHRVPVGIVTDRDIVVELLAKDVDLESITAGDVTGRELFVAREADDLWGALERMRVSGVRRLPVTDDAGRLVGILTIDDVVEHIGESVQAVIRAIGREQAREQRLRD